VKAAFKIALETFLETNQTLYTQYFEGAIYKNDHDLISVKYIPISVTRPAIGLEMHVVTVRFHVFASVTSKLDQMIDNLSKLMSERELDGMEFGPMSTLQRANKWGDVYESIADIEMRYWGEPDAIVASI
jgi:hypothetical protein